MAFIKKLFDGFKVRNKEDSKNLCQDISIFEANKKLKRINELADIANKTINRDEFYNSLDEIKDILRELAKYEDTFSFNNSPSVDLRNLEQTEKSQIELLEKRIAEKENHVEPITEKETITYNPVVLDVLDYYFVEAGRFVIEKDKASIGILQRMFKIGFNRATLIMEQLEDAGVVGEAEGTKPRKILMSAEMFEKYIEGYISECKNDKDTNLYENMQDIENILKDNFHIQADFTNDGEPLKKLKNTIIPSTSNENQIDIINLLLKYNSPMAMNLLLIDDNIINYSVYNSVPQLIIPVVTDRMKIDAAIRWCCSEMENRISKFVENGVKNIDLYNAKMVDRGEKLLPKIVCVVNESNCFFENVSISLERIFLNSAIVGIYFILFSRFSLKSLSLGILGELLEVLTVDKLRIILSQNNNDGQNSIRNFDDMDGHQFEEFCADILRKNNFKNVEVTKGSGDHGIDILAEKDDITYAIQCKCYAADIGNAAVQKAHSGKGFYRRDIAVVITNRYFTSQAIEEANALQVKLWNRDKLNEMIEAE